MPDDRIPGGDWRFLLPSPPQGSVLRIDGEWRSSVLPSSSRFGLVLILHPAPRWSLTTHGLRTIAERVRPGGTLYLEVSRRRQHPAHLRRRLEELGFADICCYWPHPSFREADLWLPLGEPAIQRYYVRNLFFAFSRRRKVIRLLLGVAARTGMFERALPRFAVVAVRTAQGGNAA